MLNGFQHIAGKNQVLISLGHGFAVLSRCKSHFAFENLCKMTDIRKAAAKTNLFRGCFGADQHGAGHLQAILQQILLYADSQFGKKKPI